MRALLLLPILVLPLDFVLWLVVIRPYCVRNGRAYTPGADLGVTMWVDWQEASELAKTRAHGGIQLICRLFLVLNLLSAVAVVAAIAGALS